MFRLIYDKLSTTASTKMDCVGLYEIEQHPGMRQVITWW